MVKKPPANARDIGSIPGSEGFPGVGNGHSLQDSWMETSVDRRTWRAVAHGVTESDDA